VRRRPAAAACIAIGGGALGFAMATAGPEVTGCTTHQCDQSSYDWWPTPDGGPGPGGGFMQDENTYVSNALDQTFLDYHGNTTVRIWFPAEVAGRTPEVPSVFVGTDDMPNSDASEADGANYTQAIGQLATFNLLNTFPEPRVVDGHRVGGGVWITNSTCALYSAQVTVHFAIVDPTEAGSAGGVRLAGAGADAGIGGAD
jgi:hypothetical protein